MPGLRDQLRSLNVDIENQIAVIRKRADELGIHPLEMQHSDGTWVLSNLLLAKAQVLNGLALLESVKK